MSDIERGDDNDDDDVPVPPDRDEGREERAGHDASQLHGKCSLRCVPSGEVEGEVLDGEVDD